MKRVINMLLVAGLIVNQVGCATVASGKSQDVVIRSKPTGAKILIDGMTPGTTPMIANLARNERHTIELTSPGYGTVTRATTRGFNWWFLGNIILGGIVGLIVDPITGAIFKIQPDKIYVDFERPEVVLEIDDVEEEELEAQAAV